MNSHWAFDEMSAEATRLLAQRLLSGVFKFWETGSGGLGGRSRYEGETAVVMKANESNLPPNDLASTAAGQLGSPCDNPLSPSRSEDDAYIEYIDYDDGR